MTNLFRRNMIFIFLSIFILTFTLTHATAQTSQTYTLPTKLLYDKPITLRYSPNTTQLKSLIPDIRTIYLLTYINPLDPPDRMTMTETNGTWEVTFSVTDTSVKMLIFEFQAEDNMGRFPDNLRDTNKGLYWDMLLCSKNETVVQGAHQARALSYSGIGNKRPEDLDIALKEIQKELALYPDNYSARSLFYTTLLRWSEFEKMTKEKIRKDIQSVLKNHLQDEKALSFAIGSYRMLGDTENAREIEKQLIQLNPASDQAAIKKIDEILKIEDTAARVQQLEDFLLEFPNSRLIDFALSRLATAAIELADSTKMISVGDKILESAVTPSAASGLAGIAGMLSELQIEFDRAITYTKKALSLILSAESTMRPAEASIREWEEQIRTTEAHYRDILGWAFIQRGDIDQGLSELQLAVQHTSQPGVNYHLGFAYESIGESDQALLYYARAVAHGGDIADFAYENFSKLWIETGHDEQLIDQYMDKQRQWLEDDFRTRVLSQEEIYPAPDFELEDISGGWVNLSDQKESVVLLCFWASWSESSLKLLQELAYLSRDFGKDVLFLTIATDRSISDIEKFVRKYRIRFPVLINNDTDKEYSLEGVPTLFIIDTQGNIHFKHKGNRPNIKDILAIELEALL